jgi:sporulation protein YlmC with PRC-barrel domain
MNQQPVSLVRLRDSRQFVANSRDDVRYRDVRDCQGRPIGKVTELLVDPDENKVRVLQVERGGLFGIGATPVFIAVEAIQEVTPDEVRIDRSRARTADAPRYDPELIDQEAFYAALYNHYGPRRYRRRRPTPPPADGDS